MNKRGEIWMLFYIMSLYYVKLHLIFCKIHNSILTPQLLHFDVFSKNVFLCSIY